MIQIIKKRLFKQIFLNFSFVTMKYSIVSILYIWKWMLSGILLGKPVNPPHLIKQKTVKKYATQFNLDILIETGTYLGHMISATSKFFSELYSIEIDDLLYKIAKKKFSKFPHIHILHGDSSVVLPDLLHSISRPCLFWLDAHYSGSIISKCNLETPIIQELQCILNHPINDHVILIDDARLFIGQNDYPTIDELIEFIYSYHQELIIEIKNDIIRIYKSKAVARQL